MSTPSRFLVLIALLVSSCREGPGNDPTAESVLRVQYEAERGETLCVALCEEQGLLAAGFSNDRLRVFSTEDGALLEEARGHRRGITCLAFAPDGTRLVSAGPDRTVRIWSTRPLAQEQLLTGAHEPLARVAWLGDGQAVLAVTVGGAMYSWSVADGQRLFFKPGPVQRGVSNLDLSRHGAVFAWAADGGNLRTWDGVTGDKLGGWRIQDGLLVGAVAVDPSGALLATNEVGSDRVEVWRMGQGLVSSARGLGSPSRSLVFLGERSILAASSLAGVLHLIDVNGGRVVAQLDLPMGSVLRLHASVSGNLLAAAGPGRRVLLWDVMNVGPAGGLRRGQPLDAPAVQVSPATPPDDGGLLDMALLALADYDPPELRPGAEPYSDQRFPDTVRALQGRVFRLRGFPLAAAMDGDQVQTFLLSRFPPGCCFGSVPVMDEWVEVSAPAGVTSLDPELRVEVQGVLEMGEIIGPAGFATSLYRMQAISLKPIDG
jgi:hypothetical protein